MRDRVAQKATRQMGRMGAGDPPIPFQHPARTGKRTPSRPRSSLPPPSGRRVGVGGTWTSRLLAVLARPYLPLAVAAVLTALAGLGVTRLQTDASAGLLADTGSSAFAGQVRFADVFGADPVVVMVEPPKGQQLLTPERMVGMAQLEGDVSRMHGVRKVYGPGTLVNTFASEVTRRALDLCGTAGKQAEDRAVADATAAGRSP